MRVRAKVRVWVRVKVGVRVRPLAAPFRGAAAPTAPQSSGTRHYGTRPTTEPRVRARARARMRVTHQALMSGSAPGTDTGL